MKLEQAVERAKELCKAKGCERCMYRTFDMRKDYEKDTLGIPCWSNFLSDVQFSKLRKEYVNKIPDKYSVGDIVGNYKLLEKHDRYDVWGKMTREGILKECFFKNENPNQHSHN